MSDLDSFVPCAFDVRSKLIKAAILNVEGVSASNPSKYLSNLSKRSFLFDPQSSEKSILCQNSHILISAMILAHGRKERFICLLFLYPSFLGGM